VFSAALALRGESVAGEQRREQQSARDEAVSVVYAQLVHCATREAAMGKRFVDLWSPKRDRVALSYGELPQRSFGGRNPLPENPFRQERLKRRGLGL
jgi:hypothetical protein